MKNKKFIYCFLAIVGLTALWVLVFNIKSIMIDKEIASLKHASNLQEEYEPTGVIVDVKAVLNGVNISLNDLQSLDEIPTTLDVLVSYEDDTILEKSAYISYSDVTEPEYIDNEYGRILLPDSWYIK